MFHFVDQIIECEAGRQALGLKLVAPTDTFVRRTESGRWLLLPCIVGEALGQLGAWCSMAATGFTLRPVAGVVGELRMLGDAGQGDSILLSTVIDSVNDEAVCYRGSASVDGEVILWLENALGPLLPLEDFDDPDELRARFDALHHPGSGPEPLPIDVEHATPSGVGFDRILSWESGRQATAAMSLTGREAFLADHFPRKPVLPLSLLLESLLQLGHRVLMDESTERADTGIRPTRLRKVKMRRFVEPGQTVEARVRVEERGTASARLSFSCEVEGERACDAMADYSVVKSAGR